MENKIFASTFYWYGKQLAAICPIKSEELFRDNRIFNFFKTRTAEFFGQFPNLHVTLDVMEKSANESSPVVASPLAFARINARSGFKRAMNKMLKAKGESPNMSR